MDKLECVQRGLARMVKGLKTLSYRVDGRTWECLAWEIKDLVGDIIAIFKDLSYGKEHVPILCVVPENTS